MQFVMLTWVGPANIITRWWRCRPGM